MTNNALCITNVCWIKSYSLAHMLKAFPVHGETNRHKHLQFCSQHRVTTTVLAEVYSCLYNFLLSMGNQYNDLRRLGYWSRLKIRSQMSVPNFHNSITIHYHIIIIYIMNFFTYYMLVTLKLNTRKWMFLNICHNNKTMQRNLFALFLRDCIQMEAHTELLDQKLQQCKGMITDQSRRKSPKEQQANKKHVKQGLRLN